jgi:hypothetical protein
MKLTWGTAAALLVLVSVLSGSAYSAAPAAQQVLYDAGNFNDWSFTSTPDWTHLRGMLLNNGAHGGHDFAPIFAPYRPESADYAVEADLRVTKEGLSFGIVVRADIPPGRKREGYAAGMGANLARPVQHPTHICYLEGIRSPFIQNGCILDGQIFPPGPDWHTYRVEASGNEIRLLIDGKVMVNTRDNRFLSAGRVGLWSSQYQLDVRSFRVIALPPSGSNR